MNDTYTAISVSDKFVDECLDKWKRWLSVGGLPKSVVISNIAENYNSLDHDSDGAYSDLDNWVAITTDAVIRDLVPAERCAIHHAYHIAVYEFKREPYLVVLARAKQNVKIGLKKKDVWLGA